MTHKNPKVSVCIPNYNYGRFIGQAIQSVIDQTFTDFELIIVDDASSDDSVSVIKSFSDERIKFYQNEKNIGRVKNINKCFSLASGEYVTLLPSDDVYLPTSLEKSVEILDSNPKVGLAYSSAGTVDENGVVIREHHPFSQDYIRKGEEEFKRLIFNNHIPVLTAMVRRECYTSLGVFNEAVTGSADREMWMRICLNNYDVAFIAEVLAYDRKHRGNVTTYHYLTNLKGMNTYRMVKTIFLNLPSEKKHLSYLESQVVKAVARSMLVNAGVNLIEGQTSLARRNIGLAIAIDDSIIRDWRSWALFFATFIGVGMPLFKKLIPGFAKRAIYRLGVKTLVER